MDDTCSAIQYCCKCQGERELALELLQHFKSNCYPPPLCLEVEDNGLYLQSEVLVQDSHLSTVWQNKNRNHLKVQRFKRLQHWRSYSSTQSKLAVLTQYLRTIQSCGTSDNVTAGCLRHFLAEVRRLEYPKTIISAAISKAYEEFSVLEVVAHSLVDILP
jgi:hypothetical protein